MSNTDWALAAKDNTIVFHVANSLKELSQPPHEHGHERNCLYADAIIKVPHRDQHRLLSISDLNANAKSVVKVMRNHRGTRTAKHVRKFAKQVAEIMWKSTEFRKRLAKYWQDQAILRDVELKALQDYEVQLSGKIHGFEGEASSEDEKKEQERIEKQNAEKKADSQLTEKERADQFGATQLVVGDRVRHLMDRMAFCERRVIDCGLERNGRHENLESEGQMSSQDDAPLGW